jgi:hypothetical protein
MLIFDIDPTTKRRNALSIHREGDDRCDVFVVCDPEVIKMISEVEDALEGRSNDSPDLNEEFEITTRPGAQKFFVYMQAGNGRFRRYHTNRRELRLFARKLKRWLDGSGK